MGISNIKNVLKLHLTLWIAILGFMTLVLLADTEREPLLEHVEWGTLLFFAALFVLMHGLEKLGLIEWIGNVVVTIIEAVRCCIAHWLSRQ